MTATRNDRRKAMLTGFLNDVWSSRDIERSDAYLAAAYTIQDVGSHVYYLDDQDRITGHWQTADRLGLCQQLQRARGA
jgi:hypothetical protein